MGLLKTIMATLTASSTENDWIDRIYAYRGSGSAWDGVHTLSQDVHIDGTSYRLMAADNSCARIRSGGLPYEECCENRWFAVSRQWKDAPHFWNSHGISDDGGKTFYTETALMEVPRKQYQVSPEEVVWHRIRVDELMAHGIDKAERMRIMDEDRKSEPWLKARV